VIYPNNFEDIVGFSPLREDIKRFCRLESAQAKAIAFGFVRDELELFKRLDEIDECNLLNEQLPSLFEWGKVVDIDESLKHVSVDGYFLMETEWVSVLTVLKSYQRFAQALTNRQGDFPRWAALFGPSEAARGCQALIVKVIDEEGNIHNNASSEYQKISLEISRMEREARNATKSIFKEWKALGYTADTDVTIREERLVIPVLAEFKRKVKGFVKDVSATGKVLFIEPASLLEVNNRLRELFADRKRERERLLKQLTRDIAPFTPQLLQLTANLSTADFIYAKWQMLQLIQAERPRFKKDG
jgi:DNA mismatch repair protein MutS2